MVFATRIGCGGSFLRIWNQETPFLQNLIHYDFVLHSKIITYIRSRIHRTHIIDIMFTGMWGTASCTVSASYIAGRFITFFVTLKTILKKKIHKSYWINLKNFEYYFWNDVLWQNKGLLVWYLRVLQFQNA